MQLGFATGFFTELKGREQKDFYEADTEEPCTRTEALLIERGLGMLAGL